jgi:glycosyltransferase involved in cell wall biosynthesis
MPTLIEKRPLRVLFLTTSMPIGGAETLLMNLVRRMDRARFAPEIVCLKDKGLLGQELSNEMPVHYGLIEHKFDVAVLWRLWKLMRRPQADAVITVGAGDKMFWGRIAAKLARVPVVASALHSTGWPDGVGRLNRLLTPWTDAFVGVADAHARHLVDNERFPAEKVHTIYNGIDCDRFAPQDGATIRGELGIPATAPVIGILAALRPEKNHELFLQGARQILTGFPEAHFLIIGDGPRRAELQELASAFGIAPAAHFLGSRLDVPAVLAACDVISLTSHNEAAPVSILEALASGVPVVAADVGSVKETVIPNETGRLFPPGDLDDYVQNVTKLLRDPAARRKLGAEGRRRVMARWSLQAMVRGYEQLIERIHAEKRAAATKYFTVSPTLLGPGYGARPRFR